MIAGIFHQGSGIGNQLHRYIAMRVLALDKDYDWGMIATPNFKAKDFMNLDMGNKSDINYSTDYPSGKVTSFISGFSLWEEKTKYYNPEFNFIEDNTIIDGEFQDERYFGHRMKEIDEWLKVEPIEVPDDLCVIGFRGGEFTVFPELFLPKEYWDKGIAMMKEINPKMRFEVHTDDPITAMAFFPDYEVIHNPAINWRSFRYAKHAIIANSSFYILPRLLRHRSRSDVEIVQAIKSQCEWSKKWKGEGHEDYNFSEQWFNQTLGYLFEPSDAVTVAPRFWARRNVGHWEMPQNYYKSFLYI